MGEVGVTVFGCSEDVGVEIDVPELYDVVYDYEV